MFSCTLLIVIWFHGSEQQMCTDLKNFQNLNETYKQAGNPIHTSVVDGLLHCVEDCLELPECEAFEFDIRNFRCTLYPLYEPLTSVSADSDENVLFSAIKDWPRASAKKKNRDFVPGFDCYVLYGMESTDFYKGRQNKTTSGYTCQRWDSQAVHHHSHGSHDEHFANTGETLEDVANYCRIPVGDSLRKVWCYTTNPAKRWEICNVSDCALMEN